MQLTINKIADADEGDYYCHAENAFGSATQPVSVRIRNTVSKFICIILVNRVFLTLACKGLADPNLGDIYVG